MNNRDYVKTGKMISLPDSSIEKRKMNNDIWKNQVFFHFLNFYKNCNIIEIKRIISSEKNKPQARIEDEIALFFRNSLKQNRKFGLQGFIIAGGVNNDEKKKACMIFLFSIVIGEMMKICPLNSILSVKI